MGPAHATHEAERTTVDTLVIGLGLSAIPLLRELEKNEQEFVVLSAGQSVWERLREHGRLDFDLVSSKHSSLYTEELVADGDPTDVYPTSSQFADFIGRWRERFAKYVKEDRVLQIVNHPDHSLVRTESGAEYRARHVVIATAFKRKIHGALEGFDFDAAAGKTVVVDGAGDSSNLIIAKLVTRGCRVILRTNGFLALDKVLLHRGVTYTLDQLEFHNIARISPSIYRTLIMGWGLPAYALPSGVRKRFFGSLFESAHPLSRRLRVPGDPRKTRNRGSLCSIPNGGIAIKYWPIDSYEALFGDDLEASVEAGYLLNDLPLFIDMGLVELWSKADSSLDTNAREIRRDNEVVEYDYLLSGDRERPNLPDILVSDESGVTAPYEYTYRNTFLGVVPREMRNVYFIGYTRPTTGGLSNIIEMQCLFVHQLISNPELNLSVFDGIDRHIEEYDRRFYPFVEKGPTDHLVWYGQYTEELAKWIGIRSRLRDCRSVDDVLKYFFYPNGAMRYRQTGKYAVPGARELADEIWKRHRKFSYVQHLVWSYLLLQIAGVLGVALLPLSPFIKFPLGLAVLAFHHFPAAVVTHHLLSWQPFVNALLVLGLLAAVAAPSALVPFGTLAVVYGLAFLGRLSGKTRLTFNDLKWRRKKKYMTFLDRYLAAYRAVGGKQES